MNYSKYFRYKPDLSTGWLMSIYLCIGVFWCIQMAIALTGHLNTNLVFQWFLLAGLLVGVRGAGVSRSVVRGTSVLQQLRTPTRVKKAYLQEVLSHATLTGLAFCAVGTILLLACNFAWTSISAITFFSLLLSISTLTSLPSSHVVMHAWRGFLYALVVLLTPLIIWKGYVNPMDYIPQLPLWVLAVVALSWPLTVCAVAGKWNTTVPLSADRSALSSKRQLQNLTAYFERFSHLASSSHQIFFVKPTLTGKLISLVSMQYLSLLMLSNIANAKWNGSIGPYHFFGMLMVVSLSCNLLLFKDLHWRQLLAPRRLKRHSFGWHIFRVSVVVQLLIYMVFACIWTLVAWVSFDDSLNQTLENAWRYRAIPLQLLAANSIAVLLFAVFNSRWTGLIVIALAGVCAGFTFAVNGFSLQAPIWFYVGPAYLMGLLVTTVFCVLLSNRLWTRQRILLHMRVH